MEKCKLLYCKNKHHKEGYCENHYNNFIYSGNPLWTTKNHIGCSIKDCNNKHHSKGLCEFHYSKNKKKIRLKNNLPRSINPYLEKLGKIFDMTDSQYVHAIDLWSKTIKKLDNNMCKNCDSKKDLNAHHIQPKKDFPELSLDLNNGVTLCDECHNELPR